MGQATDDIDVLAINAASVSSRILNDNILFEEVLKQKHPSMIAEAMKSWIMKWPVRAKNPDSLILKVLSNNSTKLENNFEADLKSNKCRIVCNVSGIDNMVGDRIDGQWKPVKVDETFKNRTLLLTFDKNLIYSDEDDIDIKSSAVVSKKLSINKKIQNLIAPDAYSLGIRTHENAKLSEKYIELKGKRGIDSRVAVIEMTARSCNVPFKKDKVRKAFKTLAQRNKSLNLQLLAQCCTMLGLDSRPLSIRLTDIRKVTSIFINS